MASFSRWYDGWALAESRAQFEARLPLSLFERVMEALAGTRGDGGEEEVEACLEFGREGRLVAVRGRLQARLHLTCQRCLETYALPVGGEFSILAVESEGMLAWASQEEEREAVLVEGRVRPLDFIEEELLLALPLVPTHPDQAECADLVARADDETS